MKPGRDRALGRTWIITLVMALGDSERLAWSQKVDDERYQRHYKDGPVFAPITGYFSVFSQTGLEDAENHFLDGSDDRLATSNFIDKLIGKHVPGGTVEATVDVDAQRVAYRALQASGARRAAAVVLDASTGAVLVMASTPSYDPDDVSTLDRERAVRAFERLGDQPLKPLLNKAAYKLFPPGSTFKTVVAAAALDAGGSADAEFGQDAATGRPASTVATPLQMAMVAAGVLNDGEVMEPRLVDRLRAPDGSTVDEISPRRMSRALTSEQAEQMRDMMEAVVERGTGKSLRGTSVLGGKTGTADVEGAAYNDRWFIGFGPRSDPRYAVAVMTEASGYGIESGPIAAEIVGALGG